MMGVHILEQLKITDPMEDIIGLQSDFLGSRPMDERKTLGQFFTRSIVSDYMASLINKPKSKTVRILDAGAGTGILTASTALRCLNLGCQAVHAVLYELDKEAIPNLEQTLEIIQNTYRQQLRTFTYEIFCEDFVLARPDKNEGIQSFDVSVINPPYFKYNVKDSPYAKAAADLYRGDPNIYASLMAIVMACMKDSGQMVTITPRSFTNGLYFNSNDQQIIRIPESPYEANILKQAETFPTTFEGSGRVVEHQTREYVTEETNAPNSVPLYRPHNITPLTASWTGEHRKEVSFILNEGHEKHTIENGTFVLLKRFSSKDEKRRLVAGVHLADAHNCNLIRFGNKTN